MFSVIGIDASMTSSGWMHYREGDANPTWGVLKFPPWADEEGKYLWQWFEYFGNLCVEKKVTHLFIEDVRFKHKHEETLTQLCASIGQVSQAAIIAYKLGERGQPIEFQAVSPIDWRREFLGVMPKPAGIVPAVWRSMLKEAAVRQCHLRGWMIDSDDIADAGGIMTFGVCTIDPKFRGKQTSLFNRAAAAHDAFVRVNK